MRENLLHYIWRYQCVHKRPLYTTCGKEVAVLHPGESNANAGPDFLWAHIRIGDKTYYGHIEIDMKGRLWYTHKHHENRSYNEVILHVIWNEAAKTRTQQGKEIVTLALADYVPTGLLKRYEGLMNGRDWIPCQGHIPTLSPEKWQKMIAQAAERRLRRKGKAIVELFKKNKEDTEATAYQVLASCLGGKTNSAALLQLCQQIPRSVIDAHRSIRFHLEALLLGQAGLLKRSVQEENPYEQDILQEYGALTKRHKLYESSLQARWKFFRLRPAHFPTIRIAQLCTLLCTYESIFYVLINQKLEDMYKKLGLQQSQYWQEHYIFGKKSSAPIPGIGKSAVQGILINGVAPLLAAYGSLRDEDLYFRKGINMLQNLAPEKNHITQKWKALGISLKSAFESQGALELFHQFCTPQKCLDCRIGQEILQRKEEEEL